MMTVTLEPRIADAVSRLVTSGRYDTAAAVVNEALAAMIEREAALAELDEAIMAGLRSADAGRMLSLDEASKQLFSHTWMEEPLPA